MAENTKIEWTEATWNPITGCSVVSPGCTNCYAMRLAGTRLAQHLSRAGLTRDSKAGPVWTGEVRFNKQWLDQPLRWKRPRMIFVCAHGDLFHESVPDEWIDKVFAVMALAPQHTFQVLTKRAKRMREYMLERWQPAPARRLEFPDGTAMEVPAEKEGATRQTQVHNACEELIERFDLADTGNDKLWTEDGSLKIGQWAWPLPNVWLGVSAEDQTRADERIPDLLATPAAVRWLSAEPLLGPVNLDEIAIPRPELRASVVWSALRGWGGAPAKIDWVVAGGESGQGARPMHPDWARALRDQCAAAGVPFFFKQWGEWGPIVSTGGNPAAAGHLAKHTIAWSSTRSRIGQTGWHAGHGKEKPSTILDSLGKKLTGRLLDGVEHNGMPEAVSPPTPALPAASGGRGRS